MGAESVRYIHERLPAVVERMIRAGTRRNGPRGSCGYGRVCNVCIELSFPNGSPEREANEWAKGIAGFGPEAADVVLSLLMSEAAR